MKTVKYDKEIAISCLVLVILWNIKCTYNVAKALYKYIK